MTEREQRKLAAELTEGLDVRVKELGPGARAYAVKRGRRTVAEVLIRKSFGSQVRLNVRDEVTAAKVLNLTEADSTDWAACALVSENARQVAAAKRLLREITAEQL